MSTSCSGFSSAKTIFSHAEANRDYVERRAPAGALVRIVNRGIPLPPLAEGTRDRFRFVTASALTPSKNVDGVIHVKASRVDEIAVLHAAPPSRDFH